jgi:chorismate synthase
MNSFGKLFKISIFGESHGKYIGIVIDGIPAGIKLKIDDFIEEIERRKPFYDGSTERKEEDIPEIISGININNENYSTENFITNGFPLTIIFKNKNFNKKNYEIFKEIPRPSHVDFALLKKYGNFSQIEGSGHLSGRLTLCLVAAGVVAKKIITPISINCFVSEIYGEKNKNNYLKLIKKIKNEGDSVGGILECHINNVDAGIGEPFFYSIESALSSIIFSIPTIKGIEFGAGFNFSKLKGSEANDPIIDKNGKTKSNNNGGITGGISNGNEIFFKVVSKPIPSIKKEQYTFNIKKNKMDRLKIEGSHDSCIILRLPPIIEAASAIALADLILLNKLNLYKK